MLGLRTTLDPFMRRPRISFEPGFIVKEDFALAFPSFSIPMH
jgi:hypothetical protein